MPYASLAALLLAAAVALGAFGAHALKSHLDAYLMDVWQKAVFYHFVHALGLLLVEVLRRAGALEPAAATRVSWLLLAGIVLFCGSLYVRALPRGAALGVVTPLGGVSFLAAWIWLAAALARARV
jgi:uncharacterized membrane protein YgdD (TMEM256/DUF423 family)